VLVKANSYLVQIQAIAYPRFVIHLGLLLIMERINSKFSKVEGWLATCRQLGDLYDSWAIADSPEEAMEQSSYGPDGEIYVSDPVWDQYTIIEENWDVNGWTRRTLDIQNSRRQTVVFREF
jgi:hypothetical protein